MWINEHLAIGSEMPHGGVKGSGFGKDMSMYALEEYTAVKHVVFELTGAPRKEWYDAVSTPGMTSDADIHLESVTKRFGEVTAVDDLTLSIPRGAFYALLGPSGCGKTTTLRMVGGFEDPTQGKVYLGGDEVTHQLRPTSATSTRSSSPTPCSRTSAWTRTSPSGSSARR